MTTDRPYRKARPVGDAVAELRRCAGTDFDTVVVEALAASVGVER
jgi:HD-GYP domain-containing protein (c-di-GMP phosphodiesterase class II)